MLDQADMADLMDLIRGEQHRRTRDKHERRFPRKDTLVAIYSRMVNAGQALSTVLEDAFPWCTDDADGIRAIFAEYTRRKRAQNVLDYDDLLLFWRALGSTPSRRSRRRGSSSTSWSTSTRTPIRSRRRSSSRCAPRTAT